jgi:hypothetical protein
MSDRVAEFRAFYAELRITKQRSFYEDRQHEYETANQQAILARNGFLLLAVLAGVAGQFLSETGRAVLGVVAALLAALAGAVTAYEALIGFASLAKLYGDAALNLAEAEIDWEANGTEAEVATAVDRVEQIFRTENGQWGQLVVSGTPEHSPAKEGR